METDMQIETGTIVQILDPSHDWYPALLIVTDTGKWGVLAYVIAPVKVFILPSNQEAATTGKIFCRLPYSAIKPVGKALISK